MTSNNEFVLVVILVGNFTVFTKLYLNNRSVMSFLLLSFLRKSMFESPQSNKVLLFLITFE